MIKSAQKQGYMRNLYNVIVAIIKNLENVLEILETDEEKKN